MTTSNVSGWLPNLLGPVEVQDDGAVVTARTALNLIGFTVTDNPTYDRTDITPPPGTFVPPSGTGFVSITGGVLDGASRKVDLASGTYVTGTLAVGNGGTGLSALGTALYVLRVNAAGDALEFVAPSGAPGAVANEILTTDGAGAQQATSNVRAITGAIEIGAVVAGAGLFRQHNDGGGFARNAGDTADLCVWDVDTNDSLWLGSDRNQASPHGSIGLYATNVVALGLGGATKIYVTSAANESWQPITGSAVGSSPYGVHGMGAQAMADADQTPPAAVYCYRTIQTTGALTANRRLTLPSATDAGSYEKTIRNACTGGFSIVVNEGGVLLSTVTIAPGEAAIVRVDAAGVSRVTGDGFTRAMASADFDGNIDPVATLYVLSDVTGGEGLYQVIATVMATEIIAGVPAPAHGGSMRCVASWKRVGATQTILRAHSAAAEEGGAWYLVDPASDEADMDLTVVASGGNIIVQVTPSVFGLYRYQLDVEIRGPVT